MTIFEKVQHAKTLREVIDFLNACLEFEKEGKSPKDIAWSMTYLLACDIPFGWYKANKYPALTELMDLTPDLEIGNIWSEEKSWKRVKYLIAKLEEASKE